MIDMQESTTAKLCSFARAYYSNLGERKTYDDFLAYDLMGKDEYIRIGQLIENDFNKDPAAKAGEFDATLVYPKVNRYIAPIPLSRLAFAEGELAKFANNVGSCQYLILGAGMDTFAFRYKESDIKIFELDHPDTQRYKLSRIKKLGWRIPENLSYCPC